MIKKRAQSWSIETYLAIAIFMVALIFFYSLTMLSGNNQTINIQVAEIGRALLASDQLKDGKITPDDLAYFLAQSCDSLRTMYKTNNDLCIYFVDNDQNLLMLDNGSTVYGIGCPTINVSGRPCGTVQ
jgi:hypothetical protein